MRESFVYNVIVVNLHHIPMNKRNKELIILIPLAAIVAVTITMMVLGDSNQSTPETFSGVMIEYNGEWIGGNLLNDGRIILLQNGTEMNYEDFKRITGLRP